LNTPLAERLRSLIAAQGPITVADYMATCLFDPQHGYYTTREPFGQSGDFVTAPEISQMFGELVGVWAYSTWTAVGAPQPFTLVEIGPGRGTLMKDMLRTLKQIAPDMLQTADVALVEISPRLRDVQRQTLAPLQIPVTWYETIADLPAQTLILVGNELFDAVPIHQFVKSRQGWRERMITLDETNSFQFAAGLGQLDAALVPPAAEHAAEGAVLETAPARTAVMQQIADHIVRHGGAGLFFDYGYLTPGIGDTLQALRRHAFDDVFAAPGEADLTAHVDFAALAATARACGLAAHLTTQGSFLLEMGLLERAGQLGAARDAEGREKISETVERLAAPGQMGELFKVVAMAPEGIPVQGFGRQSDDD
jgi:SAM-dependent MidA family methyltransferase